MLTSRQLLKAVSRGCAAIEGCSLSRALDRVRSATGGRPNAKVPDSLTVLVLGRSYNKGTCHSESSRRRELRKERLELRWTSFERRCVGVYFSGTLR